MLVQWLQINLYIVKLIKLEYDKVTSHQSVELLKVLISGDNNASASVPLPRQIMPQKTLFCGVAKTKLTQDFLCARKTSGILREACCLAGSGDPTALMEQFSCFTPFVWSCASFSKMLPSASVLPGLALCGRGQAFPFVPFTFLALKAPPAQNLN